MVLLSSLPLVVAVLAFANVSSAQFMYPYVTGLGQLSLGLLPPSNTVKAPQQTNWVLPLLEEVKWNQLLKDDFLNKQMNKIIEELKNLTKSGTVSPLKLEQLALNHEDIYKFMHHFAEVLRFHPDWKAAVVPFVRQHHWPSKYLNLFEQMMLFFLLHSFQGPSGTQPNLPVMAPAVVPPGYAPFDSYGPYPSFMSPMESNWLPSTPWMDGFGEVPFNMPTAPFGDGYQPMGPYPNFVPGFGGNFQTPQWNPFPASFPHALTKKMNCAEMVNVTVKVKIYKDVTCTASVYAPRQSLKNILAIAAQDNDCFKFKTKRRSSRTGKQKGEFISSVNTIDENDVSLWAVYGSTTTDAELNSYKPTDGETITVTFFLINQNKKN